jgi:hypothetical protein
MCDFYDRDSHNVVWRSEGEEVFELIWKMTGLTLAADDCSLVFRLIVMASEAIGDGALPQSGPFRIVGKPGLVVGGNVPPRNHDGIAFDRTIMHHAGMARRAALALAAFRKGLHMLPMAHDQSDFLDRRRQISNGDLRHPKNIAMTT